MFFIFIGFASAVQFAVNDESLVFTRLIPLDDEILVKTLDVYNSTYGDFFSPLGFGSASNYWDYYPNYAGLYNLLLCSGTLPCVIGSASESIAFDHNQNIIFTGTPAISGLTWDNQYLDSPSQLNDTLNITQISKLTRSYNTCYTNSFNYPINLLVTTKSQVQESDDIALNLFYVGESCVQNSTNLRGQSGWERPTLYADALLPLYDFQSYIVPSGWNYWFNYSLSGSGAVSLYRVEAEKMEVLP